MRQAQRRSAGPVGSQLPDQARRWWAAAQNPDMVAGLVLIGPFVRDTPIGWAAGLAMRASLARPGGWRAFVATTHTSHAPVEARLGEVRAPTLVIMGAADPDFPDPVAEAQLVADRLNGRVVVVPEAGHYPQAEHPQLVAPEVLRFLDDACPRA